MSSPHLALLALDLSDADPLAVDALLARVAQVTRYSLGEQGVAVGDVRPLLIPEMTADQFFAALASLKASDER